MYLRWDLVGGAMLRHGRGGGWDGRRNKTCLERSNHTLWRRDACGVAGTDEPVAEALILLALTYTYSNTLCELAGGALD